MSRRIPPTAVTVTWPISVGAMLVGVCRTAGYTAAATGDFPSVEVGGRRLILPEPFCQKFGIKPDDPRIALAFQMAGYGKPPAALRAAA